MKKPSSLLCPFLLLLTAAIWGFAFVTQKQANDSALGPLSITCFRSFIAALTLIPAVLLFDRLSGKGRQLFSRQAGHFRVDISRAEWTGGILCGLALGLASYLQQVGMAMNGSAGRTAFITALYVALVPVLGLLVGRRTAPLVWLGVVGAMVGAYFLAVPAREVFALSLGDLLVLASSFVFALHILIIDRFSPRTDGVRLSLIQFLTIGVLMLPVCLPIERPDMTALLDGLGPLLYLGVMSSGVAYTLQILAQGRTHPAVASVLLSLESVFGVLGGAWILGERLSTRELIGCAVMLASVLVTELGGMLRPHRKNKRKETQ